MNTKFDLITSKTKGLKNSFVEKIKGNYGFNQRKKYNFATESQTNELLEFVNSSLTDNKLEKFNLTNIKFLKKIKCYVGIRHRFGLPVRGQRTHTNAKTIKKLTVVAKQTIGENADKKKIKKIIH